MMHRGRTCYAVWDSTKQHYKVYKNNHKYIITLFSYGDVKTYLL